jgi:hypothetical protein
MTDIGAFARPMQTEVEDKQTALTKQLIRQLLGGGRGILATVASASGSSTGEFTISTSSSLDGCVRWVEEGDYLIPYTSISDDAAVSMSNSATYLEVIEVKESENKITVQPRTAAAAAVNFNSANYAAGNVLIRQGITFNDTAAVPNINESSEELMGLDVLINDDGKLFGIDRASVPSFKSYTKDAGGALLDVPMLQDVVSGCDKKGSGKPKIALMSHNTYLRLLEIADENKMIGDVQSIVMGTLVKGLHSPHGMIEFVVEKYMRDDRIYFIDPRFFELYGEPFEFVKEPGNSGVIRLMPSANGGFVRDYSSELLGMLEFFCVKPSAQGRLENFILS